MVSDPRNHLCHRIQESQFSTSVHQCESLGGSGQTMIIVSNSTRIARLKKGFSFPVLTGLHTRSSRALKTAQKVNTQVRGFTFVSPFRPARITSSQNAPKTLPFRKPNPDGSFLTDVSPRIQYFTSEFTESLPQRSQTQTSPKSTSQNVLCLHFLPELTRLHVIRPIQITIIQIIGPSCDISTTQLFRLLLLTHPSKLERIA
jgi:hypothetical protein